MISDFTTDEDGCPVCERCRGIFTVTFPNEPTRYCHDCAHATVEDLLSDLSKLRETIGYLADEVKAARAHRETKGGQQVPFHGDFASAPPSVLNRLDWWLRALGHHTK